MAKSNPRYGCSVCKMQNTRNQLRNSNGICLHCKTPMSHSSWLGGQQGTLWQLLTVPKSEQQRLEALASNGGLSVEEIIAGAITLKLQQWENAEHIEKAVRQDIVLAKLSRS